MNTHRTKLRTPETSFRVLRSPRRGITLLFVISMIVLFLLMGTTFVVVSNDYLRASRRRNINGGVNSGAISRELGQRLVVQSFLEAVRGPSLGNEDNPLRTHDLLGDMYGYGIEATIATAPAPMLHASEHFIVISIAFDYSVAMPDASNFPRSLLTGNRLLSLFNHNEAGTFPKPGGYTAQAAEPQVPGHFNGRLLTVVSGEYRGLTTRILSSTVAVSPELGEETHTFYLQPIGSDSTVVVADLAGETVIINGRAFAGTGAGQFDATQSVDMPALHSKAETPNQKGDQLTALLGNNTTATDDNGYLTMWVPVPGGTPEERPNPGSTNEPWDAVDFQNMMLAGIVDGNDNDELGTGEITPSFYRASLTGNNDFSAFSSGGTVPTRTDVVVVDNDNDGIDDGLWIDTGLPIRSTPDGEYIKPLVSFLILDMDGRLNINAHGNLSESDMPNTGDLLGTPGIAAFPRGLGFGPAEVSLSAVMPPQDITEGGVTTTLNISDRILNARYSNVGGNESQPGQSGTGPNAIRLDGKAQYAFTGYPSGFTGGHFGSPLDLYGRTGLGFLNATTPPPGTAAGVPAQLYAYTPDFPRLTGTPDPPIDDQLANSPYEIDLLSAGTSNDLIFNASDLERLVRPSDRDSILLSARLDGDDDDVANVDNTSNSRLAPLFSEDNTTTTDADKREFFRKLLTTHSFEVPAIPVDINKRLYDLLEAPVLAANGGTPLTQAQIDSIATDMALLLSPEVRRGLPMDINRIFGDGVDNDGAGIIDEFGELESDTPVPGIGVDDPDTADDESTEVTLDVDNDGDPDMASSGLVARTNFARRLFVLLVLLTEYEDRDGDGAIVVADDFFDFNGDSNGSGSPDQNDWLSHRRMLAQWCANVVDFRDPDSIMTPIEFDLNPFTVAGWRVDGRVATTPTSNSPAPSTDEMNMPPAERFAAWGMERPELLITETSALHDRRTEDLENEVSPSQGTASLTDAQTMPDEDFDNRYVPNASAFFELYNPWLSSAASTPIELSEAGRTTPGGGVDLARTAPANGGITAPVWRLVIVDPAGLTSLPGGATRPSDSRYSADFETQVDTQLGNLSSGAGTSDAISRVVYFTAPTGPGTIDGQFNGQRVYYPSSSGGSILNPGRYAVIGSAGVQRGQSYTTYLGRRTSEAGKAPDDPSEVMQLDQTQRIELNPSANTVSVAGVAQSNVLVFPIDKVANNGVSPTTANADDRSLGLSDPIRGYDDGGTISITEVLDAVGNPADGFYYDDGAQMPVTIDEPVDMTAAAGNWADSAVNRDGLTTGFRIALLQRLANPTAAYNQNINPYRTIDSSSVDLFAFNGLADDSAFVGNGVPEGGTALRNNALGTFERGETRTVSQEAEGLLWATSVVGETTARASTPVGDHVLDLTYINSLGAINEYYRTNATGGQPFPWLTWNNRPFANQYELANVPYTSPGWLTRIFSVPVSSFTEKPYEANAHAGTGGTTNPEEGTLFFRISREPAFTDISQELFKVIHPNAFGFTHLLNFAAEDDGGTPLSDRMHVAMDFLEVPSRFAGTREYVNTGVAELKDDPAEMDFGYRLSAPFDELNTYRYPGKVNLNTISSQRVWNAVLGSRDPATPGPYATAFDFGTWTGSLTDNPLRPATASNYVSGGMVPGTANAGLFRSAAANRENGDAGDVESNFAPAATSTTFSPDRNAYFQNGLRQRLGGVATNRSSVFAIWVTVGYFEWDSEMDELRDMASGGTEYGTDSGTVQRSRGFFLFDRSIPMAYEPGEDHNVERGILLQSLIE